MAKCGKSHISWLKVADKVGARCHLSIAQICQQHPFHPSQLLRLHTHHSSEQAVADSQVMHLTREVALIIEIRKRRHDGTKKTRSGSRK